MVPDDKKLWQDYARSVKPVKRSSSEKQAKKTKKNEVSTSIRKKAAVSSSSVLRPFQTALTKALDQDTVFDRKVEKQIRQGSISIEARIDLHGMTQIEAFKALEKFMEKQVKAGRRNLLVITGKGREGQGTLRSKFPDWLSILPIASQIMGVRSAAPNHGGGGAFYVLLRKKCS